MRRMLVPALVLLLVACGAAPGEGGDEAGADSAAARDDGAASADALADEAALGEPVEGFAILATRYDWRPSPAGPAPVPTLMLDLENGSPVTVARVSAHVRFFREGEDVPWWEQDFHFPVSAVLAPGWHGEAALTPAPDTDWALRAPPAEVPVRVDVAVLVLETPEGVRHPVAAPARDTLAP